jgi:hypothetical protein
MLYRPRLIEEAAELEGVPCLRSRTWTVVSRRFRAGSGPVGLRLAGPVWDA